MPASAVTEMDVTVASATDIIVLKKVGNNVNLTWVVTF